MKIAILFDMDGTVLDTLQDLADSINHTMREFGCPERSVKEVRAFLGCGARQLIALSLPGKADDPDLETVLAAYGAYYGQHSQDKTQPYAGIPEALEKLKERYALAVVSNKPDVAVKPLAQQFFPGIYALGEAADCPRKPAPDMVYKAMRELGVEKCIYVGDTEVDIETARNAGVPCLTVTWGFRDLPELEAAGADYFCDDPADMPQMLDRMVKEVYGQ